MTTPARIRLALEQLGPTDGFTFERFANRFLASEIEDLRPVGGMHDGARDAFIFHSESDPETFIQHSVTKSWQDKIKSTIDSLQANGHRVRSLIYCTPLDIQASADDTRKEARKRKVSLDIRDQGYFVTFGGTHPDRANACEELARQFVDPLLNKKGVATGVTELTSEEEQVALTYLQLELQTKEPAKALTKFSYDALVSHALRNSSPETPVPRKDVISFLERLVKPAEASRVEALANSALKRLCEKGTAKHHTKNDAFTLSFAKREEMRQRLEELLANQRMVDREVQNRVGAVAVELEIDFQFNAEDVAHDVLVLADHLICAQGRLSALGMIGKAELHGRMRGIDDAAKAILDNQSERLKSLSKLSKAQFLDFIPGVVESIIQSPGQTLARRLTESADAYCLLFAMRETGEVQRAFEKLFAGAKIWVDTSIIVPCFAEQLLASDQRRMSNLLGIARLAGIELYVGDDVLNELESHLSRLRYAYKHRTLRMAQQFDSSLAYAVQPFLIAAFMKMGGASGFATFDDFLEIFMGNQNPTRDLIEFLREELAIEYKPMLEEIAAIKPEDFAEVYTEWHQRKRKKPWLDDMAFDRLVTHDARAFALIRSLRGIENQDEIAYGHKWWWLTLDGVAYRLDSLLRKGRGASLCMSPEFFLRYVSIKPKSADEQRRVRDLLPVSVELAGLGLVPAELREEAIKLFDEIGREREYLRRRKLRDLANKALESRGDTPESTFDVVGDEGVPADGDAKSK